MTLLPRAALALALVCVAAPFAGCSKKDAAATGAPAVRGEIDRAGFRVTLPKEADGWTETSVEGTFEYAAGTSARGPVRRVTVSTMPVPQQGGDMRSKVEHAVELRRELVAKKGVASQPRYGEVEGVLSGRFHAVTSGGGFIGTLVTNGRAKGVVITTVTYTDDEPGLSESAGVARADAVFDTFVAK